MLEHNTEAEAHGTDLEGQGGTKVKTVPAFSVLQMPHDLSFVYHRPLLHFLQSLNMSKTTMRA